MEIYPNIFMKEIPLPNNPLKSINNYIVKGDMYDLMVDTAFNLPECREAIEEHMRECNVDPKRLVLFLTHLHSDHTGLASYLIQQGAQARMGEIDLNYVKNMCEADSHHWTTIQNNAHKQGLDEDELRIEDHPGFRFRPKEPIHAKVVKEGDLLVVGDYHFTVVDLKGHTPGMQGLYEKERRLLFCGDHILGKITPNITFWNFEVGDSLGQYFEHLNKVRGMDIKHLFSSHRHLISDVVERVDELFFHHQARLQETLDCLKKHGPSTVRTVTKNLSWDIRSKNWEDFPKSQKWFAAGEAMSHLEHLVAQGKVKREEQADGVLLYSLCETGGRM